MSFKSVLALEKNYREYKDNFDFIIEMPFIQKLLRENRKLKKENKKLVKYILNQKESETYCHICECCPIGPIDLTSDDGIVSVSKENIVYDITEIPLEKVCVKEETVAKEEPALEEEDEIELEEVEPVEEEEVKKEQVEVE